LSRLNTTGFILADIFILHGKRKRETSFNTENASSVIRSKKEPNEINHLSNNRGLFALHIDRNLPGRNADRLRNHSCIDPDRRFRCSNPEEAKD
jgi:hypothetical protein